MKRGVFDALSTAYRVRSDPDWAASSSLDQLAALAAGELQAEESGYTDGHKIKISRLDYGGENMSSSHISTFSTSLGGGNAITLNTEDEQEITSNRPLSQYSLDESQPLSQESIKSNLSEYGYNF